MSLALFDLDNTLLDGDSDQLWAEFLGQRGILDLARHGPEMARFHALYLAGQLDVEAYLAYALGQIAHVPARELRTIRNDYIEQMIRPLIREPAVRLVERHRMRGDTLVIITLTNRFISEPIAALFGVHDLLATEPEMQDDRFTGGIIGEPCYQHGKVRHLERWMQANGHDLAGSHFYSDSINDLPLLEAVDVPVVVNPDPALSEIAAARGWIVKQLHPAGDARSG